MPSPPPPPNDPMPDRHCALGDRGLSTGIAAGQNGAVGDVGGEILKILQMEMGGSIPVKSF